MTEDRDPIASIPSRGIGLYMLLAGAALAYFGLIGPLQDLRRGAPSVSVHMSAVGLSPLILGLGLVYSVFGPTAERILGHPQRPTRTGWAVAVVLALVGLAAYFWLRALLRSSGYGA